MEAQVASETDKVARHPLNVDSELTHFASRLADELVGSRDRIDHLGGVV